MTAAGCAVQAIAGILSMLICAIAFLALVDAFLSYMGGLVDLPNLSLAVRKWCFDWAFASFSHS